MLKSDLLLEFSLLVQLYDLNVVSRICQEGCYSHSEGVMRVVWESDGKNIPGSFIGDDLVLGGSSFALHLVGFCHWNQIIIYNLQLFFIYN